MFFYSLTVLLLPKCLGDLKYGLCSPTRDWGSRVSGLVLNCALIHEFSHSNSLGLQASVCKIYSQIRVVTVNKKEVTELVVRIWLMQRRTTKRNHAIPTPRAKGKAFQMDKSPLRAYWPTRTWIQCQVCVISYNQDSYARINMEHRYSAPANKACPPISYSTFCYTRDFVVFSILAIRTLHYIRHNFSQSLEA